MANGAAAAAPLAMADRPSLMRRRRLKGFLARAKVVFALLLASVVLILLPMVLVGPPLLLQRSPLAPRPLGR